MSPVRGRPEVVGGNGVTTEISDQRTRLTVTVSAYSPAAVASGRPSRNHFSFIYRWLTGSERKSPSIAIDRLIRPSPTGTAAFAISVAVHFIKPYRMHRSEERFNPLRGILLLVHLVFEQGPEVLHQCEDVGDQVVHAGLVDKFLLAVSDSIPALKEELVEEHALGLEMQGFDRADHTNLLDYIRVEVRLCVDERWMHVVERASRSVEYVVYELASRFQARAALM